MSSANRALSQILAKLILKRNSLTYSQFFDIVPMIKGRGLPIVEVDQLQEMTAPNGGKNSLTLPMTLTPRVRCWDVDRTCLVQLLPDIMIVNRVADGMEWEDFKDFFCQNLASLKETLGEPKYESLALKTVDRFTVPRRNYSLDQYLNMANSGLPDWCTKTDDPLEITLACGKLAVDDHTRQLRVSVTPHRGRFQIQIFSAFHEKLQQEEVEPMNLLDDLFWESSRSFASLITEKTRTEILNDGNGVLDEALSFSS